MSGKSFYATAISFFVGVAASSLEYPLISTLVFICLASLLLLFFGKARRSICVLCVACCALGFFRMEAAKSVEHPLDSGIGSEATFHGVICEAPQPKETSQRFCFRPDDSRDKILVVSDRFPEFTYGDRLRVKGKLELPENFESYEGGPEFDYVSYLAKDGIRYVAYRPEIEKIGEEEGNHIKAALITWKETFVNRIEELFKEPESSLLGGILIGEKGSLPKDVTEDFKASGLQHILVLSGYNVTIVAESFMRMFSFMPLVLGRCLGAISILFFALFTGASATTVRASIMALIVILSRSTARTYDISRALVIAALCMVLHNPMILMFDVSFELSFLATLGLIYAEPLIHERLDFVTEKMNIREILSSSIGTQVIVVPFLMYKMGSVSLISLVSNIFVLPAIPFSMLAGFVAISASIVSDFVATICSWVAQVPLTYILFVAFVSAKFPFASVQITMSAFALIVSYVLIALFLSIAWKKRNSSLRSPS